MASMIDDLPLPIFPTITFVPFANSKVLEWWVFQFSKYADFIIQKILGLKRNILQANGNCSREAQIILSRTSIPYYMPPSRKAAAQKLKRLVFREMGVLNNLPMEAASNPKIHRLFNPDFKKPYPLPQVSHELSKMPAPVSAFVPSGRIIRELKKVKAINSLLRDHPD